MKRGEFVDRLDLDNQRLLDKEIDTIVYVEPFAFVVDRERRLAAQRHASNPEFKGKAGFIGRLKQARTERLVNLEAGVDDVPRNRFKPGRDPFVSFVPFVVQWTARL